MSKSKDMSPSSAQNKSDGPTNAERQIAREVARGMKNAEIAALRSTSTSTVQNQIHALLAKLGLRNRAAIATHAIKNGWLEETDKPE